jgi:hypothetical protein
MRDIVWIRLQSADCGLQKPAMRIDEPQSANRDLRSRGYCTFICSTLTLEGSCNAKRLGGTGSLIRILENS